MIPARLCPACVSFAGYVLPSRPSPCNGLSPSLSTMRDKTPQLYTAITAFLHISLSNTFTRAHSCVGDHSIPWRVSSPDGFDVQLCIGTHGASWVLQRISSDMPWPVDSARYLAASPVTAASFVVFGVC